MWAFVILAVIFLILWLVEKQKTKSYENLKAAKAAADAYVNQKKSEVTVYTRPNTAKRWTITGKRPKAPMNV